MKVNIIQSTPACRLVNLLVYFLLPADTKVCLRVGVISATCAEHSDDLPSTLDVKVSTAVHTNDN